MDTRRRRLLTRIGIGIGFLVIVLSSGIIYYKISHSKTSKNKNPAATPTPIAAKSDGSGTLPSSTPTGSSSTLQTAKDKLKELKDYTLSQSYMSSNPSQDFSYADAKRRLEGFEEEYDKFIKSQSSTVTNAKNVQNLSLPIRNKINEAEAILKTLVDGDIEGAQSKLKERSCFNYPVDGKDGYNTKKSTSECLSKIVEEIATLIPQLENTVKAISLDAKPTASPISQSSPNSQGGAQNFINQSELYVLVFWGGILVFILIGVVAIVFIERQNNKFIKQIHNEVIDMTKDIVDKLLEIHRNELQAQPSSNSETPLEQKLISLMEQVQEFHSQITNDRQNIKEKEETVLRDLYPQFEGVINRFEELRIMIVTIVDGVHQKLGDTDVSIGISPNQSSQTEISLRQEISDLQTQLEQKEGEKDDLVSQKNKLEEQLSQKQLDLNNQFADKEELTQAQKLITELQSRVTQLQSQVDSLGKIEDKYNSLERENSLLKTKKSSLEEQLENLKRQTLTPTQSSSSSSISSEYAELVKAYNNNPTSITQQHNKYTKVAEVSETEDSVNNRRRGLRQIVILENKNWGGEYLVMQSSVGEESHYLLLPKEKGITEGQHTTAKDLFDCNGYRKGMTTHFTLNKPAKVVRVGGNQQQWQLENPAIKGELQF